MSVKGVRSVKSPSGRIFSFGYNLRRFTLGIGYSYDRSWKGHSFYVGPFWVNTYKTEWPLRKGDHHERPRRVR